MSNFEEAIQVVLKHEGGFTSDHAGATNYGISLRFIEHYNYDVNHDGIVNSKDIYDLTIDEAKAIYKIFWWMRYKYELIENQIIATKYFDMAINMGQYQATKLLQRGLLCLGNKLEVDGLIGPITRGHTNGSDPMILVPVLRAQQESFFRFLVQIHPEYIRYLKGWLNRAYGY